METGFPQTTDKTENTQKNIGKIRQLGANVR